MADRINATTATSSGSCARNAMPVRIATMVWLNLGTLTSTCGGAVVATPPHPLPYFYYAGSAFQSDELRGLASCSKKRILCGP